MLKPIVEAENISFNYHSLGGNTEAIKNISFSVERDDIISIVGSSGCGKALLH